MSITANVSVGKFYDIYKSIQDAWVAEAVVNTQSQQTLTEIGLLQASLIVVDEQIEAAGTGGSLLGLLQTKQGLLNQMRILQINYNSLNNTYQSQRAASLQAAYTLNAGVSTAYSYEANEKTFIQIYLLSLIQQGGELTESQVLALQAIAQQDPKQGGPAVHAAQGLLPDCAKPEILQEYLPKKEEEYLQGWSKFADRSYQTTTARGDTKIIISPNPAHSAFTVSGLKEGKGKLSMFDLQGKHLLSNSFSGSEVETELVASIPSGICLIKIMMEDGSCYIEKLVIQPK